jgi:hypothetical protein
MHLLKLAKNVQKSGFSHIFLIICLISARVNFKNDDYETVTATTQEEILELGKAGFTKYDEKNGVHFYRKLKKFRSHS